MTASLSFSFDSFEVPDALAAHAPPEADGRRRDEVRMLVGYRTPCRFEHRRFADLAEVLQPGDLLVVNTSATLPAALDGVDPATGGAVVVHLSTHLGGEHWTVEPRAGDGRLPKAPGRGHEGRASGRVIELAEGGRLELVAPYRGSWRLWVARLRLPRPALAFLTAYGRPIRYDYVDRRWPLDAYQSVYALHPGSAEMPSAGRPFTAELVTRLVASGVEIAPILLHCGVASLEGGEPPYPERLRVTPETARRVNAAKAAGGRVVAVGTTAVRALESAFDPRRGEVVADEGWTELVLTPERGALVVDGLLTGWHEPGSSHLALLQAVAGAELVDACYRGALQGGYRWHEFGDSNLLLP